MEYTSLPMGYMLGAVLACVLFYPTLWLFDRVIRPQYFPNLPPFRGDMHERRRG
jgi:hypothetical protein